MLNLYVFKWETPIGENAQPIFAPSLQDAEYDFRMRFRPLNHPVRYWVTVKEIDLENAVWEELQ